LVENHITGEKRLDKQKLAEIVKKIRKMRSQSQQDFGERLGVSQTTVRNWESGTTEPSLDNLAAIADVWDGRSLVQFLAEVDGQPSENTINPKRAEDALMYAICLPKNERIKLLHLIIETLNDPC
jgi:transcriptional regulator with XRE-family HTH domain